MRPLFSPAAWLLLLGLAFGLASCRQEQPSTAPATPAAPADKPVQIPRVTTALADIANWTGPTHQAQLLTTFGNAPAPADLALAWTNDALLVRVHAEDTTPIETDNEELRSGDSLDIFVSSAYGSDDRIRCVASPGGLPAHPAPRAYIYDKRAEAPPQVPLQVEAQRDANGYVLTMAVPWKNFKHVPQPGDVIGVQVMVNDAQAVDVRPFRAWFPAWQSAANPLFLQRVQLAEQADPPETAAAQLTPKGFRDLTVNVVAHAELSGKDVAVWCAGKQIAAGQLAAGGSEGSAAEILLPREVTEQKDALVKVTVAGTELPIDLKVPDPAKQQLDLIRYLPLVAKSSVFSDAAFPKIDFLNQEIVEEALGPYTLHTRFFDADWNEVTAPQAPGRYGALVEFNSKGGLTFTRELTLFKTPKPYVMPKDPYTGITLKFPAAFGLSAEEVAKEPWNIDDFVGGILDDEASRDRNWAVLVAGLHDLAKDPARWRGFELWRIDNAWWDELHKRLGQSQDYPHLVHLPPDYDKDQRAWPLLISLHGSGDREGKLSDLSDNGPLDYINSGHPVPFIVVSPLCPPNERWNPEKLLRLIDTVGAQYRIDRHRIYVMGGSMGGYGTWEFAATYPDKIAAIAPMAGGENPGIAARLKNVPVWAFHGSEDTSVYTRYSIDLVRQLQALGAPAKLTIYTGYGHSGWNLTAFNPGLYTWFLEHSK